MEVTSALEFAGGSSSFESHWTDNDLPMRSAGLACRRRPACRSTNFFPACRKAGFCPPPTWPMCGQIEPGASLQHGRRTDRVARRAKQADALSSGAARSRQQGGPRHRQLHHSGKDRPGWHGCRLQGAPSANEPPGRAEGAAASIVEHSRGDCPLPAQVEAAARLQHPNVASAFDADEASGIHFLVMEFVDGPNLASYVKQRGPCRWPWLYG